MPDLAVDTWRSSVSPGRSWTALMVIRVIGFWDMLILNVDLGILSPVLESLSTYR